MLRPFCCDADAGTLFDAARRRRNLKPFLEAHDAFVAWLSTVAKCEPTSAEVDQELWTLACCAADRGMTDSTGPSSSMD